MQDLSKNPAAAWQPQPATEWGLREASHLFRRAGFGATRSELQTSVAAGLSATIDSLFATEPQVAFDQEFEPLERVFINGQPKGLASWWLLRMTRSPCPLIEKMTLFWHSHFATSAQKVANTRAMYDQNQIFRRHGLGSFASLVGEVARDVAMLIYLDSTENRKTRPNENFARELLELFCLGTGNYSEPDIKELARCFTGWEVRQRHFKFNPYQHDRGEKAFLGARGKFDGEQAIAVVLAQPACSQFIAKKLIRFFVADDLEISDELAAPLAKTLRDSEFNTSAALRKLFGCRLFYSSDAVGRKIKSPIELAVSSLRYLDATTNLEMVTNYLESLGQLPLYPPNVKGWEGGRKWINASTILGRANLIAEILTHDKTRFAAGSALDWWNETLGQAPDGTPAVNAEQQLATLIADWFPAPLDPEITSAIATADDAAVVANNEAVQRRLSALAALPEFQIN